MEVGDQRHTLAVLPPGMTRYQLYRRLGGPQGQSGRLRKALEVGGGSLSVLCTRGKTPQRALYRNSSRGTTTVGRDACCPVPAHILAIRSSSVGAFTTYPGAN